MTLADLGESASEPVGVMERAVILPLYQFVSLKVHCNTYCVAMFVLEGYTNQKLKKSRTSFSEVEGAMPET